MGCFVYTSTAITQRIICVFIRVQKNYEIGSILFSPVKKWVGTLFELFFVVAVFLKLFPDEVDVADDVEVKTVDDIASSMCIVLSSAKNCSSCWTECEIFPLF